MPLGGLETGSLWKAYSPVFMGILNGKNPIDIYRGNLARGF
jgi:hypothetical protein